MCCLSMGEGGFVCVLYPVHFGLLVIHEVSHMYTPYGWVWVSLVICSYPVHFDFVTCILTLKSFLCLIGSGMCRPGSSEEPLRVELTLFVR